MNILFVNYGDLRSNSMNHIMPYANELTKLGHSCTVVVDESENIEGHIFAQTPICSVYSHQEIKAGKEAFPDARPADIIHAWTPRESVRRFVENYQSRHPTPRLIIHLEDNEESILESACQKDISTLRELALENEKFEWNPRLSHPLRFKEFLCRADGITLLRDSLNKLLPVPKLFKTILPIIHQEDTEGNPQEKKRLYSELNLSSDEKIIVFPGGITSNNRSDIRNLFIAIALLREEGYKIRIIKTGPNCTEFLNSFTFPLEGICLDLGFVEPNIVSRLLRNADILIQPGYKNQFNLDRFPCKIPEFLSSGRPCIIPRMYEDTDFSLKTPYCLFLDESSPYEIKELTKELINDTKLCKKICEAGKSYSKLKFSAEKNTAILLEFYNLVQVSEEANTRKPAGQALFTFNQLQSAVNSEKRKNELIIEDLKTQTLKREETISSLKKEIAELRSKYNDQTARVERIRNTFSWKSTAPLRYLRRKLIDTNSKTISNKTDRPLNPDSKIQPINPPKGHPSYHKDYYLFVQKDEHRIIDFLEKYTPPSKNVSPLISILLPVYNIDDKWLRKCIDSVISQAYPHWELCIADDASSSPQVRSTILEYQRNDNRIKAIFREENGHISRASNTAFTLSTGSFLALLDHDDELAPHALAQVANVIIENPDIALIYSDEDKIDENNLRHGPHFKSDWNYELFLGCNAISHLGVYRRDIFEKIGGFKVGFEGAQDWDLALRFVEIIHEKQIYHIPEILYHWRNIPTSTASNLESKSYANAAQKRAIESHLERIKVNATLESVDGFDWKLNYRIPTPKPSVTIIIPTKDRIDILAPCIQSILAKTKYDNYQITIIDNNSKNRKTEEYFNILKSYSRIKVTRDKGEFNYSRINNLAIEQSDSEIVCLLNNDTEVINETWLTEMVQHAIRPEVGVVGAKLLYPHQHVQHGGVILGVGGVAAHAFKYLHKDDDGHIHRAHLVSRYSAVTGACMMFRKSLWLEIGGLNESQLPVSYNDVDFCLRAGKRGYASIVTPFALLYHKESETRGDPQASLSDKVSFEKEAKYMYDTWGTIIENDPFYNPNFTRDREDFSYRL